LIVGYLMPAVVYWIVRQSPLDEKTLRRTCGAMFVFGAYLAITGLLEVTGQWSFVFPRYIADPYVGEHFGRARGPMVNSISYGLMLSVCLLCGWAIWPKLSRGLQLAALLLVPVFLASVFFSYTRSVWLGTVLAALVIAAVTLRGRVRNVVLGGAVLSGLMIAVVLGSSILAFNRNDNSAAQTSQSVSMRASFAFVSWQMFKDRPLLGFGFGQFPKEKLPYLGDRSTSLQLETIRSYVHHNTFLSLLTETGAIGLLLFSMILLLWIRNGLTLARSERAPPWARRWGILSLAVLAIYATQALFHELTYTPLDTSLIFFFAGISAGLQPLAQRAAAPAAARSPLPLTHGKPTALAQCRLLWPHSG
jgi:O-antigen ligase